MANSHLPPNCPRDNIGLSAYYYEVGGECVRRSSFYTEGKTVLGQEVGYAVMLGFGALFAVFTSYLVWLTKRYVGGTGSSEWFLTAGRNVKTGLIAAVIVSQWTWAATILQSSNVAWKSGISGPFWYASGASVQLFSFGVMAVEIKRKAPNAHTFCEIVRARWGRTAHLVFLSFALLTNVIVTSMLLLGGAAVLEALTGVNVYVASFLIPVGVVIYTLAGGLMATFLAAYLHSAIVHVALCIFLYVVYTASDSLGSFQKMYGKLVGVSGKDRDCTLHTIHQHCGPVPGNRGGSYLTMMSSGGIVFGIINVVGNFGTVFVDNAYWMSAIAARPSSAPRGYLLGGLLWFSVPFSLGSALGLAAVALDLPITSQEAAQGLVPPAAAEALMGKGGAAIILVMLFMAVTSSGSSELIAVSALLTYDVYRTYVNPGATGKQILACSRICVLVFGVSCGGLAVILQQAGLSLGWLYLFMGVCIGSAVGPVALLLLWKKANAKGAISGAIGGMLAGLISWLITTAIIYGKINLDTTGRDVPMLVGNVVAIGTGVLVHVVMSLLDPEDFDWLATRQLDMVEVTDLDLDLEEYNEERLHNSKIWVVNWSIGLTVLFLVVWPLLTLPAGVFSESYFTFWAMIALLWGSIGSCIIIVLPLCENWDTIYLILEGLIGSYNGTLDNATLHVDLIPEDLIVEDGSQTFSIETAFTNRDFRRSTSPLKSSITTVSV